MAFEGLSSKLQNVFKKLSGRGKLSEKEVKEAMREVKLALLEADVNFTVVKKFINSVTERAVGAEVLESLTPGQQVIKIVNDELVKLMGGSNAKLEFGSKNPSVILLAGLQGAGKTTMVKLLMRFYDVDAGSITLNGHNVRDFDRSALREGFGMVLQDTWLFKGTIMENIRYGRLDATDEEVIAAAKAANADHFIRTLPGGYQMELNEDASNVSQGQKQLLTIARAILSDPKILILDEPTAVLTPQEITRLFDVLRRMKADGKSIIIITHKLHEVLEVSDRVAVLRKGEYIGDVMTKDADQQSLTDMMVGRSVTLNIDRPDPINVTPRVVVDGLTVYDELGVKRLSDVSFTINAGEVLGIAPNYHDALLKGLIGAGYTFKTPGPASCCIFTVKDSDKPEFVDIAWKLKDMGYKLYGTSGTCAWLNKHMVPCNEVRNISGEAPNIVDLLQSGLVDYVFSTSAKGRDPKRDSVRLRRKAVELSIPCITAVDTAASLVDCLRSEHSLANIPLVDIATLYRGK